MADQDPALTEALNLYQPDWTPPRESEFMRRHRAAVDLAEALRIVARGPSVDREAWNQAQETALFLLGRGRGLPAAELADVEPAVPGEPIVLDDDDDLIVDDRAAYMLETSSGPGVIRRR